MKKYGVNELRRMFLEYFEGKGHLVMKSFSLVPHNDNSLLLINSGMAPLKPYFTGQEIPPRKRITTCQKCVRTGDIENVGKTARHLTFFEMLGNFSFGDYFKEEAIQWSWDFLTNVIGMDKERLYPSIYSEDEEAFEIWTKIIGVPSEKITRFYRDETGKCDNFWEHGAGPCGPCSEIYYDRGVQYGCGEEDCKVGCECDRYMEVWNNVFTQFNGDGQGNYTELAQKNIDTGMGLERLAVVVQDVSSVFDIDTMKAIRDRICELAKITYLSNSKKDESIRLITDHIRSATFMIADGIMPTNEGRGYVLRRLMRRAARHGRLLGIKELFLAKLSETVIAESKDGYPELNDKKAFILKVFSQEEDKFNKTIDQGLTILTEMEENMHASQIDTLDGRDAFKLHDTYGFPLDLTKEILEEKGLKVDITGFKVAMQEQKDMARDARKETNYMGADATVYEELDPIISSVFDGYNNLILESEIIAMTTVSEVVNALTEGEMGTIITKETPFYATMGGQSADVGTIQTVEGEFIVKDTIKLTGGKIGHIGEVRFGVIKLGDVVTLKVSPENRMDTCKNHSATHLLQKALRQVLGKHVEQAGSFVNNERLRFDFTHFSALTEEEIIKVEKIVNDEISHMLPVTTSVMSLEDAKKTGAMALFGEKYTSNVRVVKMGDFSTELCGGTHVVNTAQIGAFKIQSEVGIAAGIRRIEALTGNGVFTYYQTIEETCKKASILLKTTPQKVLSKLEVVLLEIKTIHSENESLKSKIAKDSVGDIYTQAIEVNGISILTTSVTGVDMNALRELGDQIKSKFVESIIFIASEIDGKVNLLAMVSDGAMKRGAHAGNLIKDVASIVGGGGGGRPNMAQAGGNNPLKINEALIKAKEIIKEQIK